MSKLQSLGGANDLYSNGRHPPQLASTTNWVSVLASGHLLLPRATVGVYLVGQKTHLK